MSKTVKSVKVKRSNGKRNGIYKKIVVNAANQSSKAANAVKSVANNVMTTNASQTMSQMSQALTMNGNFAKSTTVLHAPAKVHKPAKPSLKERISTFCSQAITHAKKFALTKEDETAYFAPKTWSFWRGIIMYFFLFSVVGHWMEIPYCLSMHALFGIVEDTYAIWEDPLYVPYWVYGAGAAIITVLLLPLKIKLIGRCKTMWGAALQFFIVAVVACAAMECIMGWIVNQPDEFGQYPYWDNSVLPLNIFNQAWLVNDIMLGGVSLLYVWIIFPFCQKACTLIGERATNRVFITILPLFAFICLATYLPMFF